MKIKDEIFEIKMTVAQKGYMSLRPVQDESSLKKHILERSIKGQAKSAGASSIWGIGYDYRVYCWNEASWDEPNPAARLKWVDSATYGGAVWGIGYDLRVYKWNGASWDEPNPNASLYYISAFNETDAIGIGDQGVLYITSDGGISWSLFTSITNVYVISVGNYVSNFLWGIEYGTWKPFYLNSTNFTWEKFELPYPVIRISAMFACCGVWTIKGGDVSWAVHKSVDGGSNWSEPNSNAGLHMISAGGDDLTAWGKGGDNRVFKTINGGTGWSEPNIHAGLIHVSVGG